MIHIEKHSQRQCCHHQCWIIVLKARQRKSWKIRSEQFQSSHKGCAWHGHIILQSIVKTFTSFHVFPGFPASWKPNQLLWAETRLDTAIQQSIQKKQHHGRCDKNLQNHNWMPLHSVLQLWVHLNVKVWFLTFSVRRAPFNTERDQ